MQRLQSDEGLTSSIAVKEGATFARYLHSLGEVKQMPIKNFWVRNYKAFASRTDIQVRPLTLIFGYNSVGKSALLRVLPLLAESIQSSISPNSPPLALSSEAARGASFDDLRCRQSSSPVISFGLDWYGSGVNGVAFRIRDIPEQKSQVIERLRVYRYDDDPISIDWILPSESKRGSIRDKYLVSTPHFDEEAKRLDFRGLIPDTANLSSRASIQKDLEQAEQFLVRYLTRIQWLKALRSLPKRYDTLSSIPPVIASDGDGAAQYLARDSIEGGEILDEVSDWYLAATGNRLIVTHGAFAGKELFSLNLEAKEGGSRAVDLMDTGEGMGQVLPIVTLLSMAKHRKLGLKHTLLFEHPELHLHPAAHAPLAAFFCDVASIGRAPRMIVETHSENFLLRVQLAIAKGELKSERVIIHWVHQGSDGEGLVDEIEFDDLGRPLGDRWPPGLFSENVQQSREIILARKRRRDE